MTGTGQASGELTIGIVGPHDLVERIMLAGPASAWPGGGPRGDSPADPGPAPAVRLVAAAYRDEQEAPDKVVRLGASVDVYLFASRVPHDYAQRAGVLASPATCVPLSGSALYAGSPPPQAGRSDRSS